MMKKIANILFLLLATLFVTHDVLPHHHHDKMVCIETSHCADDSKPHEHNSNQNEHKHDGNNDVQNCIFKQFIPNQNNTTQKVCKCVNCNNNLPILLFAILFSEFDNYVVKNTDFSYFPIIQSDYSVFVSKCFGLRAPPIV
ncbi:MAG: DUF6769 family protein [Deltaproteobacteria bacterium]